MTAFRIAVISAISQSSFYTTEDVIFENNFAYEDKGVTMYF